MKKILSTIFFFIICTLSFFSCTQKDSQPPQRKQILLGFSQIGAESEWRKRHSRSIIEAAGEANIQIVFDEAQLKQANQIQAIRSFIVYQVDIIAFVPIIETGWDAILQEAKEANIPVIVVDRKIKVSNPSLYVAWVGEDGIEEGRKAAMFLQQKYAETEEPLNIIEVTGTKNSSIVEERSRGFREVLSKDSKYSFIYSEAGNFLRSRGKEIMAQIIAYNGGLSIGNKKIDVIFSQNDAMTLGIIDALESNGIKPGSDVTLLSVDAQQEAIDELKKGKINCVVECNPNTGPILMNLVKDIVAGKDVPRETYMEESVFTENSSFNNILPRGY